MKADNNEIDGWITRVEDKEVENAAELERKFKVIHDCLSKPAKNLQTGRYIFGGYKEEPENLVFSGHDNENPVEFLKKLENYIAWVNPAMDQEFELGIINSVLKGLAGTWWRVVSDTVKTYKEFAQKFLGQYCTVQIHHTIRD